jgi:hypothetical protein
MQLNNEYLNSIHYGAYILEIRFVPLIGYDFTDRFRIETGLDYRVDSFINNITDQSYWMTFNIFLEI